MYIKNVNHNDALNWLLEIVSRNNHNIHELSEGYVIEKRDIVTYENLIESLKVIDDEQVYDPEVELAEYERMGHEDLLNEGIPLYIQSYYDIHLSFRHNRILYPHFHWNDKSKLVGLVGRTLEPEYNKYGIPKYLNIIDGYVKGSNVYGISHNIKAIKKYGYAIVFESEKSVLKLASNQMFAGVSVGTKSITYEQRAILISLDVEIILAFDKDVNEDAVRWEALKLRRFSKVSYIIDREGLLGEKDSPIDKGGDVWEQLFKTRIQMN